MGFDLKDTIDKNCNIKKILLVLMPRWSTLIPPLGISYLKGFLQANGYTVKTVDVNTDGEVANSYDKYFLVLKECIPENKRGNFLNIGLEVLRNHLMAHLNRTDEDEYRELVKIIVYKTFYTDIDDAQLLNLVQAAFDIFLTLRKYIVELLNTEQPDMVGMSVFRDNVAASIFGLQLTKEYSSSIKTVMGGGIFVNDLATNTPDFQYFVDNTPYIDKVIVGEGQRVFLKILRGEIPNSQKVCSINDVDGKLLEYEEMGMPDLSDFDTQKYMYLGTEASSSCPFQCSFCNVVEFWGNYRKKPVALLVAEMREYYAKYGTQLFFMIDNIMNPVMDSLSEELLRNDIPFYWDGHLRVDKNVCNIQYTMKWRKAGFYRARIGMESGSQKMLNIMGKYITIEESKEALISLAQAGIKTTTYWVIGHPEETEEDFKQTLDFIEQMQDYIYEAECHPFFYTYSGQTGSDRWEAYRTLLYPENARNMLMIQSYELQYYPYRETRYARVVKFIEHCKKLGIGYTYTLQDIYTADKRWHSLHKNSVPSVIEFKDSGQYISEKSNFKDYTFAKIIVEDSHDFNF
jgi:radical SAM superfamily enzyme YgiQ (UPF0313 family)